MSEPLVTVERSQAIRAPAGPVWTLVSGPQAWSVRPGQFAFDVTVPPGTRLRVVLGVNASGPFVGTQVSAVTELDPGRSALTASITFPHYETYHLITAQAPGTRLELTYRWPRDVPGGKSRAYRRETADALQHLVNGYRDLIVNHDTQSSRNESPDKIR